MSGRLKVHVRIGKSRLSACGLPIPDERIAQFWDDVICYHCQRVAANLPSRTPAGRAALEAAGGGG